MDVTIYGGERAEVRAWEAMRQANRARRDTSAEGVVLVEGPEDGQWAVMDLYDAVAGGFCYEWAV